VCSFADCRTRQHIATHGNTLQHIQIEGVGVLVALGGSTDCNTLQHTATRNATWQHPATPCNTLQHTTLQHTATHLDCGRRGLGSSGGRHCVLLCLLFVSAKCCSRRVVHGEFFLWKWERMCIYIFFLNWKVMCIWLYVFVLISGSTRVFYDNFFF